MTQHSTAPIVRTRQSRSSHAAAIIRQRIKQGVYAPGEQLPSLRNLSAELNLSFPAIQRAVRQLEKESILESRHGVGIRILDSADCHGSALLFGFVQPYFSRFSLTLQHYLEQALDNRSNLCVIKSTYNDALRERQEIERLISNGVHGLLIWPIDGDTNGPFLQEVSQRLPMVLVDRTLEGVSAPSVVLDYDGCGREVVRYLYKANRRRILVVCDPSDISSFYQLKRALKEEAQLLGIGSGLQILDYPVVQMIESAYKQDYRLADSCFEFLSTLLTSGQYDALFCPQCEFFEQAFAEAQQMEVLEKLRCVTLSTLGCPPQSRRYHHMKIEEWTLDTGSMMVQALNMLQDMTLARRTSKRNIRLPIYRK